MRRIWMALPAVLVVVVALAALAAAGPVLAAPPGQPAAGPVPPMPEKVEVTGIKAACRNGQTFVTWTDVAEGEAGAMFRYSLYRSDQPITQDNLGQAELCYSGVFNNSAKMIGAAYTTISQEEAARLKAPTYSTSRLNPNTPVFTVLRDGKPAPTTMPTLTIEEGGPPLAALPMWSGVAVHTVTKDGKAYYAVVATDDKGVPKSKVEPGKSATRDPADEKVAPIQPIKVIDSKVYGAAANIRFITGTKNLPMVVSLHASNAGGGLAGSQGDYYVYFGTPDMGYRDGLPGAFCIEERRPDYGKTGENCLILANRDTIEHPSGRGPMETYWFGYYCTPQWAKDSPPRAYPFTENRVLWTIDWVIKKYGVDRNRLYTGGQSMGGWGSTSFAFHRSELFAAVFPTLPRTRQRTPNGLPSVVQQKAGETVFMPDGKTPYNERMDSISFSASHHEDLPFYAWSIGRHDGFSAWKDEVDMVKALTAAHHGFAMAWNDGGHGEGVGPMAKVQKNYTREKFAFNQSFPAFGNSSLDDDLGSGELAEQVVNGKKTMEPKDGAKEGGINLGFVWAEVKDQADSWSAKLSNDLCKDAPMTVDVTPRRCQAFKPKAGEKFTWTDSAGHTGGVAADDWGLVTVPKVTIKPGEATTLTISK